MEEAVIKRIPPHNIEAERAVIGSMIMDRCHFGMFRDADSRRFLSGAIWHTFEALLDLFRGGIGTDLITLQNKLREKKLRRNCAVSNTLAVC